jgi:hypothetical protein
MKRVTSFLTILLLTCFLSAPVTRATQANGAAELKARARTVIDMLVAEDFAGVQSKFNDQLKQQLPTEKVREAWKTFITNIGSFKRVIDSQVGKRYGFDEVIVKCEFGNAQGYVQIGYDSEKKIVALFMAPLPTGGSMGQPPAESIPPGQAEAAETRFKAMTKNVIEMLAAENFAGIREQFNAEMRNGLSEEQLRGGWASLNQAAGSFKRQLNAQYSRSGNYDMVVVRCEFERAEVNISVAYDAEKKIGGLWYRPAQ